MDSEDALRMLSAAHARQDRRRYANAHARLHPGEPLPSEPRRSREVEVFGQVFRTWMRLRTSAERAVTAATVLAAEEAALAQARALPD
jgi:hypothetical protein